jgi:hypothetical protein
MLSLALVTTYQSNLEIIVEFLSRIKREHEFYCISEKENREAFV